MHITYLPFTNNVNIIFFFFFWRMKECEHDTKELDVKNLVLHAINIDGKFDMTT